MKHATLRQLNVFRAVARNMSFSRAAAELSLSQPAVSAQIKVLESHAGLPLFERLGKKLYLTAAGSELLHYSGAIADQFREVEEAMAQLRGGASGKLNIAVISAGDYFFPWLLAGFARQHPGVQLNLSVDNRQEVLRQLAENMTDLAIMVRPPDDPEIVREAFAPHAYVIVAAPWHPLAPRRSISLERLLDEPFIVRECGSDTWKSMQDAFGAHAGAVRAAMEIRSNETIKQAVVAGMGVSFMSSHAVALDVRVGNLVVLDVKGFPALRHWYVVHRANKLLPPVASAFKAFLLADGARLIRDGPPGCHLPRDVRAPEIDARATSTSVRVRRSRGASRSSRSHGKSTPIG
ncbi:MAG: LysR family transcriptional regulator [Casimicrobiaceae bacterium]